MTLVLARDDVNSLRASIEKAQEAARKAFRRSRYVENQYGARLRRVADYIGDLVKSSVNVDPMRIRAALERYSVALQPWAESVSAHMIKSVADRDRAAWFRTAGRINRALVEEIENAPIGDVVRALLHDQVNLITSLPLEAAERVHELTLKAVLKGERAGSIVDEIMRTGEVTRSRASTIARTETARTASVLTEARAMHIGSEEYDWITVGDADVRPDHQRLHGRRFRWSDPPVADRRTGARAHPGQIYNCRCIAVPVIPLRLQ